KVQARLVENQTRTANGIKGGPFALTGLLICGHCGWRMIGVTWGGRRYYQCGRYHQEGKRGCQCNVIMESKVLDCVIRKLQQAILNPATLEKFRAEVRRQVEEAAAGGSPRQAARLKRQIGQLTHKIDQGMERMALIDHDLLTEFGATVRGWKEERDRLQGEPGRLTRPVERVDLDKVLKEVEALLFRLHECYGEANVVDLRAVLRELVTRIELFFDHKHMKKTRAIFRKGIIHVRPQKDPELSSLLFAAANPIQV